MEQFLDLVHYYRLTLTDAEHHEAMNNEWAGRRLDNDEKPQIMSEAARRIPVPSWWAGGGTTLSDATMVAARMRQKG